MEQDVLLYAKRFAREGYFVFPFYSSSKGPLKPFGWARNRPDDGVASEKIIPATNDPALVDTWPDRVAQGYDGATVVGYGVLGVNCVIFDLDNKNDKSGSAEFRKIREKHLIPNPEFVVKSKSGGYHLYYGKPDKLRNMGIKSVAGVSIAGTKYPGVDVRGDGGMVVGPLSEGPESTWEQGSYQIILGDPSSELSELPTTVLMAMSKAGMVTELHDNTVIKQEASDELDVLKRGEIPERLSDGNRNTGFYLYLNALRNKGFSAETAKKYVQKLIDVTENAHNLRDSVDLDDMISRIWRVDINNPYDVCRDLIDSGLYRLTAYRSKLMYVILKDNPYIDSRSPHDLTSIKQLMARNARKMQDTNGKTKIVNPADAVDSLITPDREVATIGYKPGASEVFTLTEAEGGRRYLNVWDDPRRHIKQRAETSEFWDKFKFVVSRVFGPEGSDEYQLGLDYPAWILQRPGIKPVVAPFLMSRNRGVGKSLYFAVLSQIFGYSLTGELQARQYKVEEIQGRFFNPNGCSLLLFDEVQFPVHRNMRQESATFWKHLKSLVTLDTIPVEFKGGDTVQMPNFAGIMMAGNTGNNFPVEEFDRRIWLIDNDPPELAEGLVDEFFAMTKNEMSREEKRAIINSLLMHFNDHKIKLPLDRMRAPMSEIKKEMYLSTLSDIEEWWITYFEDRDNLLAQAPILTKSAVLYLIGIAERLMNSRWREDPEGTFRELKRRGLLQPVRTKGNNYATRNLRNVPIVKHDGTVIQDGEGRDVLYTVRQHGEFNGETNEALLQMYWANVGGITKWKKATLESRGKGLVSSL
jgi:hypothetical protein